MTTTELEVAFARERARVERYGCRFSLVALGPLDSEKSIETLARILLERVRMPDLVGRLDHERLAVLLPETGSRGAWQFTENLLPRLARAGIKVNCTVYAYPLDEVHPGAGELPSLDTTKNGNGHPPSDGPGSGGHPSEEPADGESVEAPAASGNGSARTDVTQPALSLSTVRNPSVEIPVIDLTECLNEPLPLWKRGLDIAVASTLLMLLSPLFLVVSLAIKLTSRGSIFFRQQRAGVGGVPFTFYKFRSMEENAESRRGDLEAANEADGPIFKIKEDPRMTPIGRFLRKTSIDELPQLWNVLKGDMTLVGPRPPTLNEVPSYEPWHRRRLTLKGGLTCIWQISGRSEVGFEDWMRMDVRYAQKRSFFGDLKILAKTFGAVLSGRGAY